MYHKMEIFQKSLKKKGTRTEHLSNVLSAHSHSQVVKYQHDQTEIHNITTTSEHNIMWWRHPLFWNYLVVAQLF